MTDDLRAQVDAFAADITRTVRAVLGDQEVDLRATILEDRFTVSTSSADGLELRVSGDPLLQLKVRFECDWDTPGHYMAIHRSEFHILAHREREPLFRYEFMRSAADGMPCAHLQIHAHRDALSSVMARAGDRSRRSRRRKTSRFHRMSELHFPLGGARFRPPLEDVLHMLVEEFGVDAEDEWRQHLAEGRADWRRFQTRAVVRDAPAEAVAVLRSMGYQVSEPAEVPQEAAEKLRTI